MAKDDIPNFKSHQKKLATELESCGQNIPNDKTYKISNSTYLDYIKFYSDPSIDNLTAFFSPVTDFDAFISHLEVAEQHEAIHALVVDV